VDTPAVDRYDVAALTIRFWWILAGAWLGASVWILRSVAVTIR
jgi:hypothetical protein